MKAIPVKIEGGLLRKLERIKPSRQSLTAHVRALLEREVQRRGMEEAGRRYADFVRESPEETAWLVEIGGFSGPYKRTTHGTRLA